MNIVETVKDKVGLVTTHGQDIVATGADTLKAAKEIVDHSRRDAMLLLNRTRDELKQTLKEGADHLRHKLAHIAEPTRKEQAEARKEQIKAKKRSKRKAAAKATPTIEPIHGAAAT